MSANPHVFSSGDKVSNLLDLSVFANFMDSLEDQGGRVCADYVWIGGTMQDLRSKTRVLETMPTKPEELPHWNYDGSSTGQAPGINQLS